MGERILKELREAVLDFDDDGAKRLAAEAVAAGMDPVMGLEEGLAKALREVEDSFGRGRPSSLSSSRRPRPWRPGSSTWR